MLNLSISPSYRVEKDVSIAVMSPVSQISFTFEKRLPIILLTIIYLLDVLDFNIKYKNNLNKNA